MFKLRLLYRDITEYSEKNQDWSGDNFSSSYSASVDMEDITIETIMDAIEQITFGEVVKEYLYIEDNLIRFNQLEDGDGSCNSEGKYLVDYTFEVVVEKKVKLPDYNK